MKTDTETGEKDYRKAALVWQGGKRKLAGHILPHVPGHVLWAEPFCGGLGMLCSKPRSQAELINDADRSLMRTLCTVQTHGAAVALRLGAVSSRVEFTRLRDADAEWLDDVSAAARFLYLQKLSFGADGSSYGVKRTGGGGMMNSLANARAALLLLMERLDRVAVECLDWRRCVALYDAPETFFFCDPPYVGGNQKRYVSWTEGDVLELLRALKGCRGKWLVTLNGGLQAACEAEGLRVVTFDRAAGIGASKKGQTGQRYAEIIVTPPGQEGGWLRRKANSAADSA